MSVLSELLLKAETLGASFRLSGDTVKVEAPEPLPPDLIAELRQHKPEIINRLRSGLENTEAEIVKTMRCRVCRSRHWWQRWDGKWICNVCHPNPEQLKAEWKARQGARILPSNRS